MPSPSLIPTPSSFFTLLFRSDTASSCTHAHTHTHTLETHKENEAVDRRVESTSWDSNRSVVFVTQGVCVRVYVVCVASSTLREKSQAGN
jgi:hypothetical protein